MADDTNFDLGGLTADQQQVLAQYLDVTGQEPRDAVPVLARAQWNVQIAIAKFFDGDGPDILAEAQAEHEETLRTAARFENLQDSFDDDLPPQLRGRRPEPAPRVVPGRPVNIRPPGLNLLSIIFAPFSFVYSLTRGFGNVLLRSVLFFLSFLPLALRPRFLATTIRNLGQTTPRSAALPAAAARRFRIDFEETYGEAGLNFFDGGFAQALDTAKKELKFLLMVLVSPEHDDSQSWIRNTLLAPEVVAFLTDASNNIMIWGGNVSDPEAHQVALEYQCNRYPFACVVCLTPKEGSTRMSIVKRLVGPMAPAPFISGIQSTLTDYSADLNAARAERAAHDYARRVRDEQDAAYERSLAADREKARLKAEAEAAEAAAKRLALEKALEAARQASLRQQWKRWRVTTLAPEPAQGAKDAVRLALNLGGDIGRVIRRFNSTSPVEELYAFVECYDLLQDASRDDEKASKPDDYEHEYKFQISSVMPRETFDPSETDTIGEKMGRGLNLIVEYDEPEEEEAET